MKLRRCTRRAWFRIGRATRWLPQRLLDAAVRVWARIMWSR